MNVCIWMFLFSYIESYENLSRQSATVITLSSQYLDQDASFANDGNLKTDYYSCASTDVKQDKGWVQVDLSKEYNIQIVKIYYRNEIIWKPYRFRQFYLDVSDLPATQTTTSLRTRCYTDNTTAPDVPSNIIDMPCSHTARYIIVETTYDAPDDNADGALLEVCEIEIYGCNTTQYGPDCLFDCNVNCIEKTCNNTGSCTKGCSTGFYGDACIQPCSGCPEGCNRHTGECEGACPLGKFGVFCNEVCGIGCISGCDKLTANCSCKPGWKEPMCNAQQIQETGPNLKPIIYGTTIGTLVVVVFIIAFFIMRIWKNRMRRIRNQSQASGGQTSSNIPPRNTRLQKK